MNKSQSKMFYLLSKGEEKFGQSGKGSYTSNITRLFTLL